MRDWNNQPGMGKIDPTLKLNLETKGPDVLLPVRAQPKSSKNQIDGIHDGRLKVCVTQAPEKGKANQALLKVIQKGSSSNDRKSSWIKGKRRPLKSFVFPEFRRMNCVKKLLRCWTAADRCRRRFAPPSHAGAHQTKHQPPLSNGIMHFLVRKLQALIAAGGTDSYNSVSCSSLTPRGHRSVF
tara:strand:+ start:7250 stop:7798 length:549 start_codon:yes stop_codon:yes gene_type:complete